MKCNKCGFIAEKSTPFCSECGEKLEPQKQFCRECGKRIDDDARFCSSCGANLSINFETITSNISKNDTNSTQPQTISHNMSIQNQTKAKSITKNNTKPTNFWDSLDMFCKSVSVLLIISALLLFIAIITEKTVTIVLSTLQITILVTSLLIHKKILPSTKNYVKYLILLITIFLMAFNFKSCSFHKEKKQPEFPMIIDVDNNQNNKKEQIDTVHSINKDDEYAFMINEWNVYIATAVSDEIIKIESWGKKLSTSKSVSYQYDVGTYKINDSKNGFSWIDDEHTAFMLIIQDSENDILKEEKLVTFTININDSDKNKGTNYSEKIACFTYKRDDWNMYKAIPLTDNLIKIECWCRANKLAEFLYGYDVCLINTTNDKNDFEWTDNNHSTFTITMKDNASNWKKDEFVVYESKNDDYTYKNVKTYLETGRIADDEITITFTDKNYIGQNYSNTKKELEAMGFTNIMLLPQDEYDASSEENTVIRMSINGHYDYTSGQIFKKNASIVITYNAKKASTTSPTSQTTTSITTTPITTTTTKIEITSIYEKAFVRKLSGYDIYYMFDTDKKEVINFVTNDSYVMKGSYSGNFNSGVDINWVNDGWHETFKNPDSNNSATLIDGNGFDWEYEVCDITIAQKALDSIK